MLENYNKLYDEYSKDDIIRDYNETFIRYLFNPEDMNSTDEEFEEEMEILFNFENVDDVIGKILTTIDELLSEAEEYCRLAETEKDIIHTEACKYRIKKRKEVFEKYLSEYRETRNILEAFAKSKVIFCGNEGKSFIEKDLSTILTKGGFEINFEMFYELIEELINGIHYTDKKKERKLIGKDFGSIWEKKGDGIRVFFRYSNGCIIIIGAGAKKNKKLLTTIKNRKRDTDMFIKAIGSCSMDMMERIIKESKKEYLSLIEMRKEYALKQL